MDENQESELLDHQGLVAKSRVALILAPLEKKECFKKAKIIKTGTKFIIRDTVQHVGEPTEKQFIYLRQKQDSQKHTKEEW